MFASLSLPALLTRRIRSGALALIALCGFVLISAFATALGRLGLGLETATDGRYSIGATLFTAALALLLADALLRRWRFSMIPIGISLLALIFGTASYQVHIARRDRESTNIRKIPTAALLSGVNDQSFMGYLYPWQQAFPSLVAGVASNHLALFADKWSDWLGKPLPVPVKTGFCRGHIDQREAVASEPGALRVHGWASELGHDIGTLRLVLADREGTIVGYGFTGWFRPDVPAALPSIKSIYTGWYGYVRPGANEPLTTYLVADDDKSVCPLK
jgi:hypothetical protein